MANSNYKRFYDQNIYLLANYPELRVYDKINDPFSLIKICILLQGIKNKEHIEKEVELYKNNNLKTKQVYNGIHLRLPYYQYNEKLKIYVPFFSPVINKAYDYNMFTLLNQPFSLLKTDFSTSLINPFFTYGYKLFDSTFTDLILISIEPNLASAAFYSIDMEIVFIVSDQGSLLEQINLFDSKNIDKRKDHLFDRLTKLVNYYYENDKQGFIRCLDEERFISSKTAKYIFEVEGIKK